LKNGESGLLNFKLCNLKTIEREKIILKLKSIPKNFAKQIVESRDESLKKFNLILTMFSGMHILFVLPFLLLE
jgi:hypothetical protein